MIDVAGAGIAAIASGSPATLALVFAAGAVTSVGPCVAPRYVAASALANGATHPMFRVGSFIAGLITAYLILGTVAGAIGHIWKMSQTIDSLLGAGLIVGGVFTIWRAHPETTCSHRDLPVTAPLGASFLMGAASALVLSPCCTPVIAAIIGTSTALGKPAYGALLLLFFGLGHALPLFGIGLAGAGLQRWFARLAQSQFPRIVAGGLMVALGGYYTVLA